MLHHNSLLCVIAAPTQPCVNASVSPVKGCKHPAVKTLPPWCPPLQTYCLQHKDVQAQAAAVASVAQLPPSEPQALLLARVLADSELFCRVRAAAAVALGATATDAGQVQGANLLMRFFRWGSALLFCCDCFCTLAAP